MCIRAFHAAAMVAAAAVIALSSTAFTPVSAAPLPIATAQTNDRMTPYRTMAADALTAFKAGDMATAKAKSRELEKAWDSQQKDLKAKSPEVWKSVDDAMDAFIKPLMKGGSPDAAKVQAAYDDFIAKLDAAAKP